MSNNNQPNFFSEIDSIPEILNQRYFPSLDGLRAVSIILVIIFHLFMAFKLTNMGSFANLGVQIFFVISGFLITTLLLKEKIKTGNINLKNFYIRRSFRIIPVAYLFLVVVVILDFVLKLHLHSIFIATAFLFIRNFFKDTTGPDRITTHYWSLAIEEQFYLIFPFILKKSLKIYIYLILAILFFSILIDFLKAYTGILEPNAYVNIVLTVITQFQGIAIGSLFSILIFKNRIPITTSYKSPLILLLLLIIIITTKFSWPFENSVNILKCILIAMILVLNIKDGKDFIFKFLNGTAIKFIGVLSFSIYIWQQPFTLGLAFFNQSRFFSHLHNQKLADLVLVFVLLVLLSILSYLSYFFYEKKFLKLKERFK